MNRAQNRQQFEPLVSFIDAAKAAFNAKVLHCENGQHKAGKPVELNTGANLLLTIARSKS